MNLYIVTIQCEIEVQAENEKQALIKAESECGFPVNYSRITYVDEDYDID